MTEKEKSMEEEIEALRKAARDREKDLNTLNTVLQCNQDVINVITCTQTHIKNQGCNCRRCGSKHTHTHILSTWRHCVHVYICLISHPVKVSFRQTCVLYLLQDLRVSLGEKERLLIEVERDREVWRQRDTALALVLQEKEALICCLKKGLESEQKDVQVNILYIYYASVFLIHIYI